MHPLNSHARFFFLPTLGKVAPSLIQKVDYLPDYYYHSLAYYLVYKICELFHFSVKINTANIIYNSQLTIPSI